MPTPAARGSRGGDALLAELERARTGEMLDIVATIQAEQDEIIRAPLGELLTVQGGPGTGKTAVGLHRAAFLLYNHPPLSRDGVLVLGPSRAFLRYIAQVLPSLGEEAVVQTTIADIAPKAKVRIEEPLGVRRLKGDARMGAVLRRALEGRRQRLESDVSLRVRFARASLSAERRQRARRFHRRPPGPLQGGTCRPPRPLGRARPDGVFRRSARLGADEAWFERSSPRPTSSRHCSTPCGQRSPLPRSSAICCAPGPNSSALRAASSPTTSGRCCCAARDASGSVDELERR